MPDNKRRYEEERQTGLKKNRANKQAREGSTSGSHSDPDVTVFGRHVRLAGEDVRSPSYADPCPNRVLGLPNGEDPDSPKISYLDATLPHGPIFFYGYVRTSRDPLSARQRTTATAHVINTTL
ncbi:hypothetical protein DL764_002545 [Monosporascus ibericus]|uniref:Uncharacterized protein n=1 Tax=Monosporascus ibericus TaxID=155417 RepID=A0A4Q4TPC8_9PEZI|nr:hypothetical protein DL764_002545 [Monosporascus ibericus]